MSNRAWVTLATNDSYGLGALVLAHSLRRVGSEHPAVVLITPAVTDAMRERLNAVFSEVVTVNVLDSGDAAHLALLQRPELGITFTKIHCWNLTQFEKCVFLDADTLVVQNSDELFEREELSAAPDVGWPDCFNTGVFVFKPSADTFSKLITFAQERGSFDGGDQGLLNSFFSDWARADISKHLPFLYNVTSAAFYSYLPAFKQFGQDLKIIHFIGAAKPWLQHFNFESRTVDAPDHIRGLLQHWWDIFVGQVHTQLETTMVEVEEPPETPPPVLPPKDVSQQFHYKPVVDAHSEFPWHRPEAQASSKPSEENIELADYHDRWELHRGNIPPMSENYSEAEVESREVMRQYAWDYQHQQTVHQEYRVQEERCPSPTHSQQHSQFQHTEHTDTLSEYDDNQQSTPSYHDQSEHHEQRHDDSSDHGFHQHHHHNYDHSQNQTHHTQHQEQPSHHNDYSKEYHYDSLSNKSESIFHYIEEKTYNLYHQIDNNIDKHDVHNNNKVEVCHDHVHKNVKKRRPRKHRIDLGTVNEEKSLMNGNVSDSESDYFEEIIPRHPYDGFYLRHRAIIDPRGRKICTHEIPQTPSPTPSPPDSPCPQDYDTAEENLIPSDTEDHSGVAGNLARVAAGGPHEALDDLTRRQGWEAGNIDYMGADSFDKIWAKISQTLTQPRTSPSPPKESPPQETPVQAVEVAKEAVSEPVEVAKKAEPVEVAKEAEPAAAPAPDAVAAPASEPVTAPVAEPESAPVLEPESAPVPEPTSAPVPEPTSAPVPEPTSAPVPEPTSAPVPEPTSAPVPESLSAPVPEPTPAPVLEPIQAPVSEPAPVAETVPVTESVPAPVVTEAKPEVPAAPVETPAVETLVTPIEPAAIDDIPVTVATLAPVEEPKKTESETQAAPEIVTPAPVEADATLDNITLPCCPVATDEIPVATDSPPLANTPSKEEAPVVPAAKSEERRMVGKLQLSPPSVADPLPTPDSEAEDAAALAHAIIASELSSSPALPTVTSPLTPAEPLAPFTIKTGLTVEEPQVPTPPVGAGAVSLAQIGVKPKEKTSTAAQLESSIAAVTDKPEAPKDAPKKKIIKKVVKKDKDGAGVAGADAPVPPPRKKEKKPKEK